jgi:hypothetical protein
MSEVRKCGPSRPTGLGLGEIVKKFFSGQDGLRSLEHRVILVDFR